MPPCTEAVPFLYYTSYVIIGIWLFTKESFSGCIVCESKVDGRRVEQGYTSF